jgi:hypothetical protein
MNLPKHSSLLASFLGVALLLPIFQTPVLAQTVINDPNLGLARDSDDADKQGNTFLAGSTTEASATVGEINNANRTEHRVFFEFDLSAWTDLSLGASDVQTATLSLYLDAVNDGGELDNISVYHSQTDNDLTVPNASAFEDASYTDTGLDIFTTTSSAGQAFSIDVTSFIQDDLSNDSGTIVSAFQLRMDSINQSTRNGNNYVVLGPGDATNPPSLSITQIPEPSAAALMVGSLAGLLLLRRRGRK